MKMNVLVTGAAGFIGMHTVRALLDQGARVTGVDNFDPYYDVGLKEARLATLGRSPGFSFERADLAEADTTSRLFRDGARLDGLEHRQPRAGDPQGRVAQHALVVRGRRHVAQSGPVSGINQDQVTAVTRRPAGPRPAPLAPVSSPVRRGLNR